MMGEDGTEYNRCYEFEKPDSEEHISVNIMSMDDTNMTIDTENAETSSVKVQGTDALLVETGTIKQLVWQLYEGKEWYIQIITRNISAEDILKFAQNITAN